MTDQTRANRWAARAFPVPAERWERLARARRVARETVVCHRDAVQALVKALWHRKEVQP